ncbi:hypothetical protein SNE26_11750 [Mucilaginibacter sp. cycad4]|uniref:hypothetical protein n=1 Tax=Mucilaginibacter sp. cycad4 TaxID=3342096 RepID=UPI002AAAD817|nr:hypothetical protein [Mucilaginibacter gossypii]WPV02451.1 hypothetical protein SNE26_11750 [Mucilaginibacter gossypii]
MLNTYNTARKKNSLTKFEILVFGLAAALTLVSIVMFFVDKTYFGMIYNQDGGFTGYITALLLTGISGVVIVYLIILSRYRSISFTVVLALAGVLSLFFVAQVMSGLPDIIHTSTHELFKVNNTILRTNASSIIKINEAGKIAFHWLLIAAGAFYFLILPFIYRSNFSAKRFVDKTGIPIPHRNHIIAMAALTVLAILFSGVNESEVLWLNLSAIFLLILLCPENIGVFRR